MFSVSAGGWTMQGCNTRENGRARLGLKNVLFVFLGNQDWENGDS